MELKRRSSDNPCHECDNHDHVQHPTPCPMLSDHLALSSEIHEDIADIKIQQAELGKNQAEMLEILNAWKQTKGFVQTMQTVSSIAKWLVMFGGTCGAIYYFFVHKG